MIGDKYIGLDVHQATISTAVLDSTGKLVIESVIETKAHTILQFFQGLRGNLYVTFEEGTSAAWSGAYGLGNDKEGRNPAVPGHHPGICPSGTRRSPDIAPRSIL